MREEGEVALRRTRSRRRAEEWALVLAAEGLSPRVRAEGHGFALALREGQAEAGLAALAAYERENPPRPERHEAEARPATGGGSTPGVAVATALTVFFLVSGPHGPGNPWFEAGRADSGLVLAGQPWRTVTALTLHADLPHLVGNALMGGLLVAFVCGGLGSGVGLAAVLLAGAGGNALNALLHPSGHSSVGASTAVFGALGVLCGSALWRQRRRRTARRRWPVPIAAGLGVIAMLGVGGARTDLWAHLFGFATGVLLGLPLALPRRRLSPTVQLVCGAAALAAVLASWQLALSA